MVKIIFFGVIILNLVVSVSQLKNSIIQWAYWSKQVKCEMKDCVRLMLIENIIDSMTAVLLAIALIAYYGLSKL